MRDHVPPGVPWNLNSKPLSKWVMSVHKIYACAVNKIFMPFNRCHCVVYKWGMVCYEFAANNWPDIFSAY
jgi:hypothetical protein